MDCETVKLFYLTPSHSVFQVNETCYEPHDLNEKDSGMGRCSDDSAKHSECSEQETPDNECLYYHSNYSISRACRDFPGAPCDEGGSENNKTPALVEDDIACCNCSQSRPASQNSIDRELEDLHREMENLSVISQSFRSSQKLRRHSDTSVQTSSISASRFRLSSLACAERNSRLRSFSFEDAHSISRLQRGVELDSSSAYNTGESSHSSRNSPVGQELRRDVSFTCATVSDAETLRVEDKCRGVQKAKDRTGEGEEEIAYTTPEKLQETIYRQQLHFAYRLSMQAEEQQFDDSNPRTSIISSEGTNVARSQAESRTSETNLCAPQKEWRIKKRADGTRYITRKPARNKILKQRETKLLEERCGMTTDDDMISEMKAGRHWSREDRKRHWEKSRDQRRRRELMAKSRMECLREKNDSKKEPNILELSQKKQSFKNGKNFDDFVTVQEMLVHGSKVPRKQPYRHLLSVTTV